jgi:lipid-binding SYLF domain-containing protein
MHTSRRCILASFTALALVNATGSVLAASKPEVEAQGIVEAARATIADLSQDKDFAGFRGSLATARGVLVFPHIVAAGLVLGGTGGNGVLMVRNEGTGEWDGPVFYTLGGVSVGLEVGAYNGSVAIVVQSEKALDSIYKTSTKLGADATVALGSKASTAAAAAKSDVVVYSKVKGAFAGVAVDGVVLKVRDSFNKAFYGKSLSPSEMVLAPASATPSADGLRRALRSATH